MMLTAKRSAPAWLTVSEMPSTAIEPLTAISGARLAGTRDLEAVRLAHRLERHDLADRVDMAEHDVAAQLVADPQRALEIDQCRPSPSGRRW